MMTTYYVAVNRTGRIEITLQRCSFYRGADKSLARSDWKNNWKVAIFHPTWRSVLPRRPGWMDNLLNFFF